MPRSLTTHIDSARDVGRRLRDARTKAGLSQRQLAFPGCTAAYISRLEAGARIPSLQMVNQLAARLDVTGSWLATGVDVVAAEPADLVEAEVALRLGELDTAEALYRPHADAGDGARATALAGLGQVAFARGNAKEAVELLEQALALRGGHALVDPGAVDTLGRAYMQVGGLTPSVELFERAVAEAVEAEAVLEELRFSVALANVLIDRGDFSRAETVLARVMRITDESGDPIALARLYWSQSRLHSRRDEPRLAGRYARRALEILERTENDAFVAMAYHLLATTEVEAGNGGEALRLLEYGRELRGELDGAGEARFGTLEARALLLAGRPVDAARAATRALGSLEALGPGDRGLVFVALADVFAAAGDGERARHLLEEALDLLHEHRPRRALEAARKLAELLEAHGDTAGALAVLKRATDN
ncbi:MAG TPA: tetratricopeptide repeat protein [Gaiellaceae bacterium]|nr:tetratricopeptide repeat protein [Gaiellaceae bacterium]